MQRRHSLYAKTVSINVLHILKGKLLYPCGVIVVFGSLNLSHSVVCFGSAKLSFLASVGAGAAYSRSSRFLCWHHLSVLCEGWSTRARSLPVMCSRKSCVKRMNKPDSPLHPPCRHLGPGPPSHLPSFFSATGSPTAAPADSCGTLVNRNSSQPHRMTGSRSAVTVGVRMSGLVCETERWKTQEVGQAQWC